MIIKERVLKFLEENSCYTPENIAAALSVDVDEVKAVIAECEADGTLLGYTAVVDWSKTGTERCNAIIEINVETKTGDGFEAVARQICALPEVTALYLMSGGYDFAVMIEGRSMREVAMFVYQKLAVIDGVTGTATHFVLNKYKDKNMTFGTPEKDEREWL